MAEKIISPGSFLSESDKSLVQRGVIAAGAALVGPTVKGRPFIPTPITSYSEYELNFGSTFRSGSNYYEYFTSLAAKEYFQAGGKSMLVVPVVSGSLIANTYAAAYVPISGSTVNAQISSSFELETLAWGDTMNNSGSLGASGSLVTGSANNVRWEVSDVNYTKGTFTILVRRGDDLTTTKNVLETWTNLSLDPQLPNFISRVIGDNKPQYNSNGYVEYLGNYGNASQYVRVKNVFNLHVDSLDNTGVFRTGYAATLPNLGSGSIGGAFTGGVASTNRLGTYFESIGTGSADNVQGFAAADYILGLNLLTNKDEYDFNLLLVPGVTLTGGASAAASTMIDVCQNRGDAMTIIDCTLYDNPSNTTAVNAAASQNTSYGATYWPWVQIFSSGLGKAVWVPASVVMGGVYAFNDQVSAAWFAPAGINRGGIGSVLKAQKRLSQTDRDTLYDGNVNPIATFPGEGVVAYGQKTLQKRATSLDRVNVRRLMIELKKFVGGVSRTLVFENNTSVTRSRFLNTVEPYLESVVQRQGLYAFKVVMDESNNTPDVIDRNQLVGQIFVQPTKTSEFIIIDFVVLPTGAIFP
jgi:hypothetical protein